MKNVFISKEKLLSKIKENRNSHQKQHEDALEGWQEKVIVGLEDFLNKAKSGIEFYTHLDLPEPESYTQDYDDIIAQIEWNEEKVIELDLNDFKKFILDDWNWKNDFLGTNAFYSKLK